MTADEFKAWRARHKLSERAAALAIGCSRTSIRSYEAGKSEIPRYIALACAAYSYGLKPMGDE